MKTSLVLSTYNGEKYIEEQLESLYLQTRKLDSVLILDDKSTDGTVEIIRSFIEKQELTDWTLKVNEKNQGWMKNFWCGIRQSEGDVIFLCDQDDIWDHKKVETMTKIMEDNSHIQLLASAFEAKYEEGNIQRISPTISKTMNNTGEVRKVDFSPSFMYVLRPGCTYAFRADLWKRCDEYWHEKLPHDAMLWRHALLEDGLYTIDLPLIQWRRCASNTTNPYRSKDDYKNINITMYHNILDGVIKDDIIYAERLLSYVEKHQGVFDISKQIIVKKCFEYQKILEKAFEKKSLIDMGIIFLKYRKYFYAFRTYVKYFLIILKVKRYK